MAKIVYTLKEHLRTGEYHFFEATPNNDGTCSAKQKSIC